MRNHALYFLFCTIVVEARLQFTFTKVYPDEIPLIEIASSCNIEEADETYIIAGMKEEVWFIQDLSTSHKSGE